jgi:molybdopterin-synthase adenylyltransferase
MRYTRQEKIIGKSGQGKLISSTVAIIGVGALGTATAELLTRAGIGKIILIDRDIIELSNLQRQLLFVTTDVGKPKATTAKNRLGEINPDVKVLAIDDDLDFENISKIKCDLILDCTDNLETRFLINEYAKSNKIPWIYSAAVGNLGRVWVITPTSPCFRCIFNETTGLATCSSAGVLNTITTSISAIQTTQAIKVLLGKDYEKNMITFNIWTNQMKVLKVKKNKNCPVCAKKYEYLTGKKKTEATKLCGSELYQIKDKKIKVKGNFVRKKKITIFKGRALVKAKSEKEARSIFSKTVGN